MSNIIAKRRIFGRKKSFQGEFRPIKNPAFDHKKAREANQSGVLYPVDELIPDYVLVRKKTSHIEYRIVCKYCGGDKGWVRRKDAQYCSAGCRKMAYKEKVSKS